MILNVVPKLLMITIGGTMIAEIGLQKAEQKPHAFAGPSFLSIGKVHGMCVMNMMISSALRSWPLKQAHAVKSGLPDFTAWIYYCH